MIIVNSAKSIAPVKVGWESIFTENRKTALKNVCDSQLFFLLNLLKAIVLKMVENLYIVEPFRYKMYIAA